MSGDRPVGGAPIRGPEFETDSNLREGGYVFGSLNPLNDMMGDFIRIVKATDPEALDGASYSYASSRNKVDATASLIADSAKRLAENWKGEQADAALKTLEQMYKACMQIWETAENTSRAVSTQADVLRQHRAVADTPGLADADAASKWLMPVAGGSMLAVGKNEAAKYLMRRLNDDTRRSHNQFPESARADFPDAGIVDITEPPGGPKIPTGGGPPPGGGSPGGGGPGAGGALPKGNFPDAPGSGPNGLGSEVPRGGLPGSGVHPPGSSGDLPGTGFPGGAGGSGTGLAGFNPGGGAGGLGAGAGGGLGVGGAGALDPLGGAAGGGNLNAGPGGSGAMGGIAGRGFGSGASGSGNRGMMPMAPHGGQGGEEKERERSTWLTEDDDVWSAGDDAAPPVIG